MSDKPINGDMVITINNGHRNVDLKYNFCDVYKSLNQEGLKCVDSSGLVG